MCRRQAFCCSQGSQARCLPEWVGHVAEFRCPECHKKSGTSVNVRFSTVQRSSALFDWHNSTRYPISYQVGMAETQVPSYSMGCFMMNLSTLNLRCNFWRDKFVATMLDRCASLWLQIVVCLRHGYRRRNWWSLWPLSLILIHRMISFVKMLKKLQNLSSEFMFWTVYKHDNTYRLH